MKEPSASVGSPPVPAFLMKLWALLEEPSNSDVITWSSNGQNFCILDEQKFSKEILPKYFKHNNLSSFIRQLNMYGFKKVLSLESGLVKCDSGSGIEFQHQFFKKGKAELLENIKRKMPPVKAEDTNLTQDDLQKIVTELQDLKHVQSNMDTMLENMRRENRDLWKEVSSLRRRHSQQQKLLSKVLQFILSLMRGNIVLAPNRKRQLTLEPTQSPTPKYSRHVLGIPKRGEEEVLYSPPNPQVSIDNMLEIHEIISPGEGTSDASIHTIDPAQIITVSPPASHLGDLVQEVIDDPVLQLQTLADQNLSPSKPHELALDVVQSNTSEDPDSVINSILSENCTGNDIDLLDQDEIQDFLSCIDASLEELQSILSQKKLNIDPDVTDELFKPDLSSSDTPVIDTNTSIVDDLTQTPGDIVVLDSDDHMSKEKQLMQYTGNPLLSLFDLPSNSCASSSIDPGAFTATLEDDLYPYSLSAQNDTASQNNSELLEDFIGSSERQPIFVLSPVTKLIEEVTDSETGQ
ncbi:heat shock factor protein 3-like [Phyllobates terribilis]|uniref:heat shock factor protein 3-like n=1 Tax=Phyllobates terribilis TaxID=111132 RepID=UPI003CCADA14